jgi:hypothetical protein
VRKQKRPSGRAADHHHFKWQRMQNDAKLATRENITTEDHREGHDNTDHAKHGSPISLPP